MNFDFSEEQIMLKNPGSKLMERDNYKKFMQEKRNEILSFPDEERKKWTDLSAVRALPKNWIERQNAARRPGGAVMRKFLEVLKVPECMPQGY